MSVLLIDVGNSRLKWMQHPGGGSTGRLAARAIVHEGQPADAVAQIEPDGPVTAIRVANVTGPALGSQLASALERRFGIVPQMAVVRPECSGLRIAYADPARLGVDRWLGLLAAWSGTQAACVVVSAGTALTVDVVDDQGQHLGGVIAPGLMTAQAAVLGATRFVAAGPQTAFVDGLGTNTDACVRQGALHACAGLVDRLAARYPNWRRLLTGGDATTLAPYLVHTWTVVPDLVLDGLQALSG